jgi:DNA replicative helicase MCM subunit Mcm2 (Cdc46/Mcm family)
MPAGQTPVTVTIVAHNDLVDAVQPGDRYVYDKDFVMESRG